MNSKEDLSLLNIPGEDEIEALQRFHGRHPAGSDARSGRTLNTPKHDTDRRAGEADRAPAPIGRPWERAGRLLGWRILGGFWAVLFGAVGIGAICLQIAGPPVRTANLAPPAVQTRTQPLPAAPASAPNPQASPLGGTAATQQDPRLAGPAAPEFHAPAPTPPSSPALSAAPGRPLDPQPTVEATPRLPDAPPSASKPATEAVAVTPVTGLPDSAQPALLIHYPAGSSLAEADAEKLAAQADPASHNSILAAPAGAPAVATIKYYDVKDHASAQAMGKALQKLGYRWRIEKGSDRTGQPPAAVEVWMPNK